MKLLALRLVLLGAAAASACAPDFRPAARVLGAGLRAPREELFERRRKYFDARATQIAREHGVLILADHSTVAHGRDRAWYPSGRLRHEREFERGEPRGLWRSWYENGALESEARYEPGRATQMSWRRPDGSLSSCGEHVMGLREGEWREFHANGQLAALGCYARGERDGLWSFFDDAGRVVECGWFVNGHRSGAWEH